VIEASIQIWLGIFLIILGISFGRMGPAFQRNKYYLPILIIGILSLCIRINEPEEPELLLSHTIEGTMPWFFTGFLGYYLALIGAPTYFKKRFPQLILGWIIILLSFYLYFEYSETVAVADILVSLSSILGVLASLLSFSLIVRIVENRIPPEEPAPELTANEKEFVRHTISKNIGVGEE
jgi:hypothetical protein